MLREAGRSWVAKDRAWKTMENYIYVFARLQQHYSVNPDDLAWAAASYLSMLPADRYPYMHELTARVADGSHDGTLDFGFGL